MVHYGNSILIDASDLLSQKENKVKFPKIRAIEEHARDDEDVIYGDGGLSLLGRPLGHHGSHQVMSDAIIASFTPFGQ